jgi:hypothetical protein
MPRKYSPPGSTSKRDERLGQDLLEMDRVPAGEPVPGGQDQVRWSGGDHVDGEVLRHRPRWNS